MQIDDIYRAPFHPPGSPDYAEAIRTDDTASAHAPNWAMVARNLYDVVSGIEHARSAGLMVMTVPDGEAFRGSRTPESFVLIRTRFDRPVRVDPLKQTATVPAGATWGEVVSAAAAHGLAAVHGDGTSSDAVASLLRGGIGAFARRFGVSANHVNSITIVTADGGIRLVTVATDPRLFWALRGGGDGFGIVTEVEISLQPVARVVTSSLEWESHAAGLLAPIWLEWSRTAPREASSSLRLTSFPDSQRLVIDTVVLVEEPEDTAAAVELMETLTGRLRLVAPPLLDTRTESCPDTLLVRYSGSPGTPSAVSDHFLVSGLTAQDLEHLCISVGARSGSTLADVELRRLGGDLADPERNGGAFDRTDAEFSFAAFGLLSDSDSRIDHESYLGAARARLSDRRTGFTLPAVGGNSGVAARVLRDDAVALVDEIRDEVDPAGLFHRVD
jgi:hypothetical protein